MGLYAKVIFQVIGMMIFVPFLILAILSVVAPKGELSAGLFFAFVSAVGWFIFSRPTASRKKQEEKIKGLPDFIGGDYSHAYGDTGISLNKEKSTLFLISGKDNKVYSLSDVREWRYVYSDEQGSSGDSLARLSGINERNASETGFFVKVKDVDFPEWHIKFAYNSNTRKELARWMEIFEQVVNRNV